jgi:Thioredoxin
MSKSLKHYKSRRRNNKTQRLRKGSSKLTGGRRHYMVFPDDATNLRELTNVLDKDNHHLLALHSSETCGHCEKIKPEWNDFMARLTPHPNLTVAKLGQGATDYMNNHHYRKHNHAVNGVPTIVYYIVNNKPQEYDGERTADKIIDWLTKVMADNNLELTIKPKPQDEANLDDSVVQEQQYPESGPDAMPDAIPDAMPDTIPDAMPESKLEQVEAPASADAFPQEPLPPASTLSKATETIKSSAAKVDNTIEQGVSAVKDALTNDLNLGSLFSADAKPPPPQTIDAADTKSLAPIPAVPSLVGGRRRTRRRKHRRSKNKHSKKSRKSKK